MSVFTPQKAGTSWALLPASCPTTAALPLLQRPPEGHLGPEAL